MRVTKTQSRTPPTRPYPLHKKIKILFLGGTFIRVPIVVHHVFWLFQHVGAGRVHVQLLLLSDAAHKQAVVRLINIVPGDGPLCLRCNVPLMKEGFFFKTCKRRYLKLRVHAFSFIRDG